jgi:hypothetical protein
MDSTKGNRRRKVLTGAAVAVGSALAGGALAATLSASATTSATTLATSSPTASTPSGGPGVQENDGIAESQEHHGGFALNLTGTVTAVGADTVTIKTSGGAIKVYKVDSSSDIDKNGEAQLSSLTSGDAVRYSVRSGTSTIGKLHAGNEAKDAPTRGAPGSSGASA